MKELNTGMLTWADQILTATNATRISINSKIRDMSGRGTMPEDGDKIICLRNYWDIFESPLVNGTIGYLKNCSESYCSIPPRADKNNIKEIPLVIGDFITDTSEVIPNLNISWLCHFIIIKYKNFTLVFLRFSRLFHSSNDSEIILSLIYNLDYTSKTNFITPTEYLYLTQVI